MIKNTTILGYKSYVIILTRLEKRKWNCYLLIGKCKWKSVNSLFS